MARNPNSLRRDVQDLAVRVLVVHRDLDAALVSLKESQPGFPTSSMGGGGGPTLSEDGTPPGLLRFVLRMDPASRDLDELGERMIKARRELIEIQRIVTTWSQAPFAGSDEPTLTKFDTDCIACQRYCSGAPSDRLRSGFCPACHSSWQRWRKANKGDRHAWLTLRRRQVAEAAAPIEAA